MPSTPVTRPPGNTGAWRCANSAGTRTRPPRPASSSGCAPTLWASHYTLGLVLRGLPHRRAEALGPAGRSVELAPGNADPYVLLGLVYSDAHDFTRAAEYYRTALEIDPQHAFATSNLSGLELRKGRFAKAMRGFRAAAAASPQEEVFHRNIVAAVLGSLLKYGLMIAVLTVFAALFAAASPHRAQLVPRLVVLGVVVLAWSSLLTVQLRPLSRYLRGRLRAALRLVAHHPVPSARGGFVINQAARCSCCSTRPSAPTCPICWPPCHVATARRVGRGPELRSPRR